MNTDQRPQIGALAWFLRRCIYWFNECIGNGLDTRPVGSFVYLKHFFLSELIIHSDMTFLDAIFSSIFKTCVFTLCCLGLKLGGAELERLRLVRLNI